MDSFIDDSVYHLENVMSLVLIWGTLLDIEKFFTPLPPARLASFSPAFVWSSNTSPFIQIIKIKNSEKNKIEKSSISEDDQIESEVDWVKN